MDTATVTHEYTNNTRAKVHHTNITSMQYMHIQLHTRESPQTHLNAQTRRNSIKLQYSDVKQTDTCADCAQDTSAHTWYVRVGRAYRPHVLQMKAQKEVQSGAGRGQATISIGIP